MPSLLLHLNGVDENQWAVRFRAALPALAVYRRGDSFDPAMIDYALVWKPETDAFAGLSSLKALFSYGAGVDALLRHPRLPPTVPLVRFVDPELTGRMSEYIVAEVTSHARLATRFRRQQAARRWEQAEPPMFSEVNVGIMGLGQLGSAAAAKLRGLGFGLRGWSRTKKVIPGMACFGEAALDAFLGGTAILCCLLPLTPATTGILDYALLGKLRRALPDGPVLINAARGGHHNEPDLVRALGDGTLAAASLDVFASEPLPANSPLWALDNCTITPHVAAMSTAAAGVAYFAQIIAAHAAGTALPNQVDRSRGY